MVTQFNVGDKVIAHTPGNNPKRGVLISKADGRGWGIYQVQYTLNGETNWLLTSRIEHDKKEESK
jgi:hypothetical protein